MTVAIETERLTRRYGKQRSIDALGTLSVIVLLATSAVFAAASVIALE